MSFRVQWSASALDRLIEILDFIAQGNPMAARRVVDDLLARVEALSEHPRLGPVFSRHSSPEIRRLILGRYVIVYRIQEVDHLVTVIAVRDTRQRPLTLDELSDE